MSKEKLKMIFLKLFEVKMFPVYVGEGTDDEDKFLHFFYTFLLEASVFS